MKILLWLPRRANARRFPPRRPLDEVQRTIEETYPTTTLTGPAITAFRFDALAGFKPDELAMTVEQTVLTIEGRKTEKERKADAQKYLPLQALRRHSSGTSVAS